MWRALSTSLLEFIVQERENRTPETPVPDLKPGPVGIGRPICKIGHPIFDSFKGFAGIGRVPTLASLGPPHQMERVGQTAIQAEVWSLHKNSKCRGY